MKRWLAGSVVVLVLAALVWPKSSSVVDAAQDHSAVQLVPPGTKQAGNPGEKGATYYALESQTTRLTTRFKDGHVAIAERSLVGDVSTTVSDLAGNERARLRLNRIDGTHDMLHFTPVDGPAFQAVSDPSVARPTLDWAARQAYGLTKDGAANLVWDGGVMRSGNAARRDAEKDVDQVETSWADGLAARLSRQTYSRREITPGRVVGGPVLVSELTQYGAPAGTAVWFEDSQVFAYALPGLMSGMVVIGAEELKPNYGGWPFKPDTTWLNLQIIAAHHFHTQLARKDAVARGCRPSQPTRLAQLFMPTVHANEAGCDDFHWLDGTVVRDCCDDHDRCYAKSGCDSSTWWQWWKSWSCDRCNIAVVGCFFARGTIDDRCLQRQICAG